MPIYPKPHSRDWFRALEAFNPEQAAMTKKILELAGRDDVCSFCGDDPAKDYQLVGEHFEKDTVTTIRLCDDCRRIRESMYNEKFVPMPW
jgi:hypothetical protein